MTTGELFLKATAAGMKPLRAASLIGYAHVIQQFGSYKNTLLTPKGQWELRKDFEKIGCDPREVQFGPLYMKILGPARDATPEQLAELARSCQEEEDRALIEAAKEARKRIRQRAKEAASVDVGSTRPA